jgi:hypothetical protein
MQIAELQFEKRKNLFQQLVERNNWLTTEMDALRQKGELVHDDNPSCPLCDQSLSASRRKFLRGKFAKQQSGIEHQLSRISIVRDRLKQLLIEQHQEITKQKEFTSKKAFVDAEQKNYVAMCTGIVQQEASSRVKYGEITEQLCALEKEIQKQHEMAQRILLDDGVYHACDVELKSLEKAFAQMGYDEQAHELVRKNLPGCGNGSQVNGGSICYVQ